MQARPSLNSTPMGSLSKRSSSESDLEATSGDEATAGASRVRLFHQARLASRPETRVSMRV